MSLRSIIRRWILGDEPVPEIRSLRGHLTETLNNINPQFMVFRIDNGYIAVSQEDRGRGVYFCKDAQEISERIVAISAQLKLDLVGGSIKSQSPYHGVGAQAQLISKQQGLL